MHLDNERYFYISGFLSLGLTLLIILSIGLRFFSISSPQSFALRQSETISISLYDAPQKSSANAPLPESSSQPKIEEVRSEAPETPQEEVAKVPEITDLFSTVKPTKENKKSNEKSNVLPNLSALEEKVLSSKRDAQFSEKVKTLDLAKSSIKMAAASGSTGPLGNEYHAKSRTLFPALRFNAKFLSSGETKELNLSISLLFTAFMKLLKLLIES